MLHSECRPVIRAAGTTMIVRTRSWQPGASARPNAPSAGALSHLALPLGLALRAPDLPLSSLTSRRQGGAEAVYVAVETRVRACLGHEISVVVDDQAPPIDVQSAPPGRDPDVDAGVGLAAVEIEDAERGTGYADRKTVAVKTLV